MSPYRRNILLGVTVLGAVGIFAWMVLKFSTKTAEIFGPPQMPLQLISVRVDGLSEGSGIYYLGVNVGRVTGISRSQDGRGVSITAQVDREPPLPGNVHADITQSSLIGGASNIFLELDSKEPAGALVSGSTLKANYVGLQLLPPTVADAATQIAGMSEDIRKLSQQLRQSNVIGDLDRAIKNADDQASKFGKVMDSALSLLGDEKMRDDLRAAIASIRHTTEQTDHIAGKLDALTDSLKNTSDTASVTLKDAQQHMDLLSKQIGDRLTQTAGLMASIQDITEKLNKGQGTAGQLLNDPRLYEALLDSAKQLNLTVGELRLLVEQWEQEGVGFKLK
jgi:phospholipid/cholesterol/gamma-HCH transport system substrate-binding protein